MSTNWKETFERLKKGNRIRDYYGNDVSPDPIPLIPDAEDPAPFPMDALGPLRRPAEAIARVVQGPGATAAQSVLAVAALATQAYADVVLPHSGVSPISLFFLLICESGDRKTSTDRLASRGVLDYERELREAYKEEMAAWAAAHSAWKTAKKKIEGESKKSKEEIKAALEDLGPAPEMPLSPIATISDFTIEGLSKHWLNYPPSLGLMTSEGGSIIGGAALSDDAKLRTAAGLSSLWDGGEIRRTRAADGLALLFGRRLSAHIMAQPDAARRMRAHPPAPPLSPQRRTQNQKRRQRRQIPEKSRSIRVFTICYARRRVGDSLATGGDKWRQARRRRRRGGGGARGASGLARLRDVESAPRAFPRI